MREAWFAGLASPRSVLETVVASTRSLTNTTGLATGWSVTLRYVALDANGEWVALVGFASPALSCGPRDRFIGWSEENQMRRLRFVASNQRFCILPAGRRQNTASAVMSRALKRLSADWVEVWGYPVLLVETFVDPSRHLGTCYGASSFIRLGETAGYGGRSGRHVAHHQIKHV